MNPHPTPPHPAHLPRAGVDAWARVCVCAHAHVRGIPRDALTYPSSVCGVAVPRQCHAGRRTPPLFRVLVGTDPICIRLQLRTLLNVEMWANNGNH